MGFEVLSHFQCGAWQTRMKMADEFQILLFCCSCVWCSHAETWKHWNIIFLQHKGCFYHSPEILQGLHTTGTALLLYCIKPTKLLPAENQFLHGSYYRTLICTRKKCVVSRLIKLSFNIMAFRLLRRDEEHKKKKKTTQQKSEVIWETSWFLTNGCRGLWKAEMHLGIPSACTVWKLSAPHFQTLLYLWGITQPNYTHLNPSRCGREQAGKWNDQEREPVSGTSPCQRYHP